MPDSTLMPMLTVRNAAAAVEFYKQAFGAIEGQRFTAPTGQIVAELSVDSERFFVVDENPEAFNLSPETLGGTRVRMSLMVDDRTPPRREPSRRAPPRSSRLPISHTA